MVEQVGYDGEEHLRAELDLAVGDRRREVRFAAAGRAAQEQPERRLFGIAAAALQGISQPPLVRLAELAPPAWMEVVEAAVGQGADLAAPPQPVTHLALAAGARDGPPEIGMPERDVLTHETEVFTDVAGGLGFNLNRLSVPGRAQPRPNARDGVPQPLHL